MNFPTELISPFDLIPHPQNYRIHPPEQVREIAHSIEEHGVYRNVVICQENYILAGHGVWQACLLLELDEIPVYRLPIAYDSPQALKVLAADNTLGLFAIQDDWALAQLLQGLQSTDSLLGTGYNESSLADLLFISRPQDPEDEGDDPNEHWKDMPEFTQDDLKPYHSLKVHFKTAEDLAAFAELMGQTVTNKTAWIYYPKQVGEDLKKLGMKAHEPHD